MRSIQGFRRVVLFVLLTSAAELNAQAPEEDVAQEGDEVETSALSASRFSLGLKFAYHTFWKQGLLENGEKVGRPGLGAGDLAGIGGELDVDYHLRPYLVLTATAGAYEGGEGSKDIEVMTAYGLLTAKLQNSGDLADYYFGAGFGGYFSRIELDDTSYSLKPGVHALAGIRIHLADSWSLLLEDRLAFTTRAKGGFNGLNLGGNFILGGIQYQL